MATEKGFRKVKGKGERKMHLLLISPFPFLPFLLFFFPPKCKVA
jgi:hypothetical protein